jgi:hypothetical protein
MSGPLVAVLATLGIAAGRDEPPGLVDASVQLAGHAELQVAEDRDAPLAAVLALSGATGSYANTIPPPPEYLADSISDRIDVTRVGIGVLLEARTRIGGLVQLVAGGGPYLAHVKAAAHGELAVLPIPGDYFVAEDTSLGAELRGGVNVRVAPRALLGLRGGWTWYHANLGQAGRADLGGPWIEAGVTVELTP